MSDPALDRRIMEAEANLAVARRELRKATYALIWWSVKFCGAVATLAMSVAVLARFVIN